MSTAKRALLYVTRMRKRTILLFCLMTVLMTISLMGLSLYTASKQAARDLRGSIGGYFTIQTRAESEKTDGKQARTDEALLGQVSTLDNIRRYNGVDTYYLFASGVQLVPGALHGTGMVGEFMPRFIGCTDTSLHERFVTSACVLTEGRHVAADDRNKALISVDLAERNGLGVGDTITGVSAEGVRGCNETSYGTAVTYAIVGLYHITRNEPKSPQTAESDLPENFIFTDIASAKELYAAKFPAREPDAFPYSAGLMLFLADPDRMEQTVATLREQPFADWSQFIVSENNTAYEQAAGPIQKAASISRILLLVLLALSVGILTLILMMWTRERMTELGILVSLGIGKRQIGAQLLIENYVIGTAAFAASLVLTALLSQLLMPMLADLAGAALPLDSTATPAQAAVLLAFAAVVILTAVLLSSIQILRKKPKQIFTELS